MVELVLSEYDGENSVRSGRGFIHVGGSNSPSNREEGVIEKATCQKCTFTLNIISQSMMYAKTKASKSFGTTMKIGFSRSVQ